MVFYPKTHQIPWGYLNSFLSVPRKEARAEAGILLTTRSSSLKKKNLVCSTRTALCHKIGIDLDLNRMHGTLAPKRKEAVPLLCTVLLTAQCVQYCTQKMSKMKKQKAKKNHKKCEDSISTHILQEKENGKTNMLCQDKKIAY